MARQKGSRTGRCQGCNHVERVRIERFLAAGASIKGAARKFAIDYHALRRHWRNHVSAEARAAYIAGAGATKDQLEEIVADESLGLIDHYRIVRGALYKGFTTASELGTAIRWRCSRGGCTRISGICGRLTGELQRGTLLNIQNDVLVNPDYTRGHCQLNLGRATRVARRMRDHAAATAYCHWFAASARKIRSAERETRWR
jgi:hypothetical protein